MVSITLLILVPVLVLAAVVVGGIALFTPSGSTKPTPKVTPTLPLTLTPTPPIPISKVIFTSGILPGKGEGTPTFPLPSSIVTAKYGHSLVDEIPPSSLSSAVVTTTTSRVPIVTTTSKVPEVITTSRVPIVTTTYKVPEVITTTRVPEVVTTTSKVPEAIATSRIPEVATSKVVTTTYRVPEVATTSKIPEVVTTKVITTTSKIPEVVTTKVITTTSKIPEVVTTKVITTTSKIPEVVTTKVITTTSKIPELVTTKSLAPPTPAVTTTTTIAEVIPALAPIPAVSSDTHTNEVKKKDGESNEEEQEDDDDDDDDEDDEEDWEGDDDEEEEEDESSSMSGTTGIKAVDVSDSRYVETVQYDTGFKGNNMKKRRAVQPVALKQDDSAQTGSVSKNRNNKDDRSGKESAIVGELQKRIDEIVKQQSSPFEAELFRIMTDLLDSQDAMEYQDVLDRIGTAQQQKDESSTVNHNKEKDAITQSTFHAQDDATPTPENGGGFNPRALLNTLLQPFIIQFRTDVRNTVIFICGGQHDGLIDGTIQGNDDYAKKAAQDDIVATTHPDGVHLMDLFDPNTAALALDCLRTHFGHLTTALGKLLTERFAAAKEFLLNQIAGLVGIPRFLIPFSEEEREAAVIADGTDQEQGEQFAKQSVDTMSETGKEELERSGAFARWLVDSMMNEFQLAVEQDQDLFGSAKSNIEAVANLPDAEKKAQVEGEDEDISRPSTPVEAVAGERKPSQPRIRSRRSTNKI